MAQQDPLDEFKRKLLVFTWETAKSNHYDFCIGKSVEGNYTIGAEEIMENFWKWNVYRVDEWIMDSNNYSNGNCTNKKDAITMAINVATTHYDKNSKTNWK